jgi:rhodanese-related sulfurtransferase
MTAAGFENVSDLVGGIKAWLASKLPIDVETTAKAGV